MFVYVILSIVCFLVKFFPGLFGCAVAGCWLATGHLVETVGDDQATNIVKTIVPLCIIVAAILSVFWAVFVWRNYEEMISKGLRRWTSNLKFFQNRIGFTIATLFESLMFNSCLLYIIVLFVIY